MQPVCLVKNNFVIPLIKFKQLLGDYGKLLSDAEIEKIRQDMYILSGISFDFWETDKKLRIAKNDERGV